ncbi:MAG: YbaK/EbsC family protein [Anaerolineales bacterium]|jgi:prolyl-tRNA editing enzyme YbaK/EbsC (Cys-tRNA(Pro) deacylase)
MLNTNDLRTFLAKHDVTAEIITLPVHTLTVMDAAKAVGTTPDRIVKSLLFLVKNQPVLAIASGTDRVDRRPIAIHYGVGRKRVKLADAETVVTTTGYIVGAVPPFGHVQLLPTLIDPGVLQMPEIFAGGGAVDALLRISPQEIMRLTDAIELNLHAAKDDSA